MKPASLRLGLVGPLPPPNGGMAMQLQQLAGLLGHEDIGVDLVQTNPPYRPAIVRHVKGLRAIFLLVPYLWRVWRMAGRVDVIHLMANSGWSWQLYAAPVIWLGWLRKTPVIVNYRGGAAREYLAASGAWVKPSLEKATCLVVPSGFLQQVFSDFGVASSVIPNIIDPDIFHPAPAPVARAHFTIVITRNLEAIYGLDTAIRAVAIVREAVSDVKLKIAGSGPQREELQALVDALGLGDTVVFLGRLGRAEVVDLYHNADVMLNPTRVDNMPNSVLEAMACGLPVVSTNVGGVPYIVRDGETALLVPPDDAGRMAQAVLDIHRDKTRREALASNGLREVAQYYWSEVRLKWLNLYGECGARV
ncbi:MAG: glycosyltransferase family 4 protein [Halioglobus sp.]|nr:glycosyltransferase family 4 protein [Halioglobus sp.]